MARKYARIFKPKHLIYSLLTHKLIASPAFIAVQTGAFSKCKIFSRYRKNISSHRLKNLKMNQNQ